MRRAIAGLTIAMALAIVVLSLSTVPQAPAASVPVRAAAVTMNLNYSDPASDVYTLWKSNNSHLTDASGAWFMSPFPSEVNLEHFQSLASATTVQLSIRVQGSIATRPNTTYTIRLYTTSDNTTHYIVDYNNGTTAVRSNHTGSSVKNLTGTTISPASTLNMVVPLADLGPITAWRVDGNTRMVGAPGKNYTYEDFIWSIPGNPGSAPAAIQGHVTDAATGKSLANVNVSVGTFYTTTNATGYYLLPATYGNITVDFVRSGYNSLAKQVMVLSNHTATLDAQMTPVPTGLGAYAWIIVLVVVAAIAIVAVLLLRRRRSRVKPPAT